MVREVDGISRGIVRGLWPTLERALRGLSDIAGGRLRSDVSVVIQVPWLLEFFAVEVGTLSLTAGQASESTIYTVPQDERRALLGAWLSRASGDNTIRFLTATQPVGYGSGSRALSIDRRQGLTEMVWPSGGSDVLIMRPAGALILEPGALVGISGGGAGVAASAFDTQVAFAVTKIVRDKIP